MLVNIRQNESAKPSRNVHSAKPELRHHQQNCLTLTSVVPSATGSLELELAKSAILEHTNSSMPRMWLRLVIVSSDRRTIIKENLNDLIEWTLFHREGSHYLAGKERNVFFTSKKLRLYFMVMSESVWSSHLSTWQYVYTITKLLRHILGIQMGTNCAPLVADLFLLYYERDFMMSLSKGNQS